MKPIRIWTKNYEDGSKEWIEFQDNKYYIWKAEELELFASFPICFKTLTEKFKEQDREFKPADGAVDAEQGFSLFL